jgi:tetratricopeptide (TPR) repeat protein
MVVTAPVTLLLFDIWPLARIRIDDVVAAPSRLWPLVREKLPHFALAVLAAVLTVVAQSREGAVAPLTDVSVTARLATVPVSYVSYLVATVWPGGLAFFYPRSVPSPILVVGAVVVLVVVSGLAWRERARPYLAVGWAWYLATLLPVSGIVQAGDQLLADRYTYVPLIGVFMAVAWGARDLARTSATAQLAVSVAGGAALVGWAALAFVQVGTWRDSISLTRHALAVTRDNHVAHNVLGTALLEEGRLEEAIAEFRAGVAIAPGYADLHSALGRALARRGDPAGAVPEFQQALRLRPDLWHVHQDLGRALASLGETAAAVDAYRTAIQLQPDNADLHNDLGLALGSIGRYDEALAEYRAALAINPGLAAAYNNLAHVLLAQGSTDAAVGHFAAAVRFAPDAPGMRNDFANALALQGRYGEAIAEYREALRMDPGLAEAHDNLGLVLYETGQRSEAVEHFRAAVQLKPGFVEARRHLADATSDQGR